MHPTHVTTLLGKYRPAGLKPAIIKPGIPGLPRRLLRATRLFLADATASAGLFDHPVGVPAERGPETLSRLTQPQDPMGGGYVTTLLLLVCISGLIYLLVRRPRSQRSHLPPGPAPLPFLGNALELKAEGMVNSLRELRDTYGPVFTVHLGPRRVVVLWGYEAVKEALEDRADEFSGRGKLAAFEEAVQGFATDSPVGL
ncbi:hypothetical protein KIL84_001669 [Mauremys mutica]|uniref:Cytochrome P450 n=1 Tax=Mauremys mutica TaxID=74926 RepID=A0A9D4B587_9SAUR|nr:hypothetical protein KIL84_001669 [Mauremys mutica]